jgi:excinuclease UvrABC ATPase subunit
MPIGEAAEFFQDKRTVRLLKTLEETGLGYLTLGQTLSSLSGGESQRLKIASEIHKTGTLAIMDEPTTGLHMSDIDTFYGIVERLLKKRNTVVIIEHNLDIIRRADWIIDLGPGGGKDGGELIFEGTPEDCVKEPRSITGLYLKRLLG